MKDDERKERLPTDDLFSFDFQWFKQEIIN